MFAQVRQNGSPVTDRDLRKSAYPTGKSHLLAIAVATLLLAAFHVPTCLAGKNEGGALIVHTQDAYVFSAGTVCTTTYGTPASCEEAVTRSDKDVGTVVWLLAAFPDSSSPAVSGIYFGIDYDDSLYVDHWKMCAPAGSIELPDSGWPSSGTGNSIAFGTPVTGNHLFPLYAFKIDGGTDSSYFSTGINPTGGYAAFIDDSFPPATDEVTRFGTVRWYASGHNDCPASPPLDGGDDPLDGSQTENESGSGDFEPPQQIPHTYRLQVLDTATNQPVSGITIDGLALKTYLFCYQINCFGCVTSYPEVPFRITTNAEGIASYTTYSYHCTECGDSHEEVWCRMSFRDWGTPAIVENPSPGQYSDWILARCETNVGGFNHVLHVSREEDIATQFAPVLHRNRGLENQEGLGDPGETGYHGTLRCVGVSGALVAGPYVNQGLHNWSSAHGVCSFIEPPTDKFWIFDIDNSYRHAEGTIRPVFYHVFPKDGGAIIQYWYYFNANDPLAFWPFGFHEGDWEHVSIFAAYDGREWHPSVVNFYQHTGGNAVEADQCWWSMTAEPSYMELQQGYDINHTHLHAWIAPGSHASYNRFDAVYTLSLDAIECQYTIWDYPDYNLSDNPSGSHGFFAYDALINMGEYWNVNGVHEIDKSHTEGPVDACRFVGPMGKGRSECSPTCPDWICEFLDSIPILDFDNDSWGPFAPTKDPDHDWRWFHGEGGTRWGNESGAAHDVLFSNGQPTKGDYAGLYRVCSEVAHRVGFSIPVRTGWESVGSARVERISGDVVLVGASSCGNGCWEIPLAEPSEGVYDVSWDTVSGSGAVSIDVWAEGWESKPDAEDLGADIVEDCAAADVGGVSSAATLQLRVFDSISRRGETRLVVDGLPSEGGRLEVFGADGRLVFLTEVTNGEVRWSQCSREGRKVPGGVYLMRLSARGPAPSVLGRIVIVR